MRAAVRIHKSVAAEISVVVFFAPVSAVAVFNLAVAGLSHNYTVVAPLPDKAAAETFRAVEDLMIIFEVSRTVSHCMTVFAENKWTLFFFVF